MIRINIHQAKTHLSRYLAELAKGETILLCNRNEPMAEIRPIPQAPQRPRRIGWAKGQIKVKKAFFKPLPKDLLDRFGGRA